MSLFKCYRTNSSSQSLFLTMKLCQLGKSMSILIRRQSMIVWLKIVYLGAKNFMMALTHSSDCHLSSSLSHSDLFTLSKVSLSSSRVNNLLYLKLYNKNIHFIVKFYYNMTKLKRTVKHLGVANPRSDARKNSWNSLLILKSLIVVFKQRSYNLNQSNSATPTARCEKLISL